MKLTYDELVDKVEELAKIFPHLTDEELQGKLLEEYEAPDEGRWASEREWARYQESRWDEYF